MFCRKLFSENLSRLPKIITAAILLAVSAVSCELETVLEPLTAHLIGAPSAPPKYEFEPDEFLDIDSYYSGSLTPPKPFPEPTKNDYEYFFNYRLANFTSSTEPFIKERFGSKLGIKTDSLWEHPSYNSFAVGFATSLATISAVEYGETVSYGSRTEQSESYFYNHLHYLKNLQEGKIYHYRIIVADEDGNTLALPDRSFTTKTFTDDITKLYQSDFTHTVEGTLRPGLWITDGGIYVLMEDITSDGLGITVKAHNVTIDLNGHTLTYDNGNNPYRDEKDQYDESASVGIRDGKWNFTNIKIYNGVIKQGETGTPGNGPLFLYHMGGTTRNEIAGLTVDYYSESTPGMYTNKGKTHHNLLYDRGSVVKDRHMAVRALVSSSTDSEVYYNSLRRFRQRGIDDAAFVHDNELYSDSFVTNSFALGGDDNAVLKNNKIFGMGYHPIGIGWGRNFLAKDNFIYIWCFAPVQRSDEYSRKSSVAGMRFTNFESSPAENMIYEGNTIVLKATNNCTMARGIWTANSSDDKNIIYRHNTVKTEAMPGNLGVTEHPWDHHLIYYNGDVNNAIAPVTVQGGGSTSLIIPDTTVFEDNRFISNVSHIIIGEGYGIGSGVRFYRNTLEKIGRDSDHKFFYPVRIGFWYWNTFQNRIIDSILVNLAEEEIKPHFYGGSGNMEISYGKRKTFLFSDGSGNPVTNRSVTLNMPEGGISQTELTDAEGKASFDILSVMYYKYGDGKDGGYSFKNGNIDYSSYIFSASGYKPYTWMPSDSETLSLQSE